MSDHSHLISSDELAGMLGQANLSVVDASWYLPAQKRDAKREFEASHLPNAVFFDQDAVVDPASSLPHTLPPAELFATSAGRLGIAENDTIVVYDGLGLFSAPRVWWLFRTFGARDVRVLQGGLPAWIAAGLPTESGPADPTPRVFTPRFDRQAVVYLDEMRERVGAGDVPIADARSAERFEGSAPEPRLGVRSGHMPGALSLPFGDLAANGRLKSPAELRQVFEAADLDPQAPVITSCGSGVTAAVINLALATLGNEKARLFDGSWTEWGSATDTAVETGPAQRAVRS